jgi:hypothetical protein
MTYSSSSFRHFYFSFLNGLRLWRIRFRFDDTNTHSRFCIFLLHSEGRVQTAKVWMRKQQHYFLVVVVVAYGVVVSAAASCGW